jgi:hypothetical protein
MWVELDDGHTLGVPLAWFPRLLRSTQEQRDQVRISPRGLDWEALDEDISIDGLLEGLGDQSAAGKTFAGCVTVSLLVGWPVTIASWDRCPSGQWGILSHSVV